MISDKNILKLIYQCGQFKESDQVLIVFDDSTEEIASKIFEKIQPFGHCKKYRYNIKMHGGEPSEEISEAMFSSDLIFGLTKFSMAHSLARGKATQNGARYLSLPDYSLDVINSNAFDADFFEISKLSNKLINQLSNGKEITITSSAGTKLTMNIFGRNWNNAPGILLQRGDLGSPPDSEINIAPNELMTNGKIVVDGSIPIPEIGLLNNHLILEVVDGLVNIPSCTYGKILLRLFGPNKNNRIIGEFGIGLNSKSKLCGRMLEDEGALGTCHFGVGSNSTIGGANKANIHIDFIIKNPNIFLDNEPIFKEGKWLAPN